MVQETPVLHARHFNLQLPPGGQFSRAVDTINGRGRWQIPAPPLVALPRIGGVECGVWSPAL